MQPACAPRRRAEVEEPDEGATDRQRRKLLRIPVRRVPLSRFQSWDEVPSDQAIELAANPGERTGLGRPVRCFVCTVLARGGIRRGRSAATEIPKFRSLLRHRRLLTVQLRAVLGIQDSSRGPARRESGERVSFRPGYACPARLGSLPVPRSRVRARGGILRSLPRSPRLGKPTANRCTGILEE
jgi:hypothetical protein